MDLEDGEIVEDECGKDVREAIRDSIASHKRISYHDQSAVSGSIRSNGSSRMPEKRRNQDASVENEGRPVDDRLRILRLFEKEKSGKRVEMNIAIENKSSIEVCNDQKGIDEDIERTEKANKVEHHEQISEIPDDEWIFESLGFFLKLFSLAFFFCCFLVLPFFIGRNLEKVLEFFIHRKHLSSEY